MKFLLLLLLGLLSHTVQAGRIAISFDDSPTEDSHYLQGEQRTEQLIQALKRAGVEQAIFFANTVRVDESGERRLRALAEPGHLIANHSHSHQSAGKLSVGEYMVEVETAHQVLSKLPGFAPFHRFPYLNRGEDASKIAQLNHRLGEMGYKDGYVTVDNYDFYISHLFDKAVAAKQPVDMEKLEALYVDTLWQAIQFYDGLAVEYLGRSPNHVVLLHENDAAVLFIEALVDKIRAEGWEIISAMQAYNDPMADWFDPQGTHGQGRVAAIAHQKGASQERIRHSMENTRALDQAFAKTLKESQASP